MKCKKSRKLIYLLSIKATWQILNNSKKHANKIHYEPTPVKRRQIVLIYRKALWNPIRKGSLPVCILHPSHWVDSFQESKGQLPFRSKHLHHFDCCSQVETSTYTSLWETDQYSERKEQFARKPSKDGFMFITRWIFISYTMKLLFTILQSDILKVEWLFIFSFLFENRRSKYSIYFAGGSKFSFICTLGE